VRAIEITLQCSKCASLGQADPVPPHDGVGTLILAFEMERRSVAEIMDLPLQELRQGRLPFT
jgi:hypothetical protein